MADHYNVHERNRQAYINMVKEMISPQDAAAQLAEECAELAQASLKLVRVLNRTNPTPMPEHEIMASLEEEFGDILNAVEVLGITPDPEQQEEKMLRWAQRLLKAKEECS